MGSSVRAFSSEAGRGGVAQRRVAPTVVVVVLLVADHDGCVGETVEAGEVQTFVADTGVERLHLAVSPGLAGRNVGNPGPILSPIRQYRRSKLPPVLPRQHSGHARDGDDGVEFVYELISGD